MFARLRRGGGAVSLGAVHNIIVLFFCAWHFVLSQMAEFEYGACVLCC